MGFILLFGISLSIFFVSPFCIMYNKDTRLDPVRKFMLDLNISSFFTSFKTDLLCEDFCMLPIMYHQGFELECFQHLTKPSIAYVK